ncbi:MAG: rane-fusion protein, partial [Planctomycetota bacterium]|nr:rane-fusion protein [Planctomycetota bacterium]
GATGGTTKGATGAMGAGAAPGGGGGGGSTPQGGGTAMTRPVIKSFTMQVQPHVPLRPRTAPVGTSKTANQGAGMGQGGGQGGRGGGGGGGGNRGGQPDMGGEKPGSTKILSIVPEGQRVKSGDIVCELDSSAFQDELQAQLIRWAQARAWVDQASQILAVSKISLLEYRDGIYPQDLEQLGKYIEVCRTQLKQSQDSVQWSREMVAQSFQSPSQLRAAELGEQQMRIALIEAEGMHRRLLKFTAPRLITNLEAKIASVEADLLAQESTFQLEDDRKRRLERMIELCTLRAPRDGMIAYAATTTGGMWNPTVTPIQEGAVVRQGQSLVMVPDPTKMRVKVRVNESKVSHVFVGQRAVVRVEAFADRPLYGTVTEITAIPAPASGFGSDVKLYFANVDIDQGFEGLRTGLSAQVAFFVAEKPDVARIPIESIRWSGGEPFAAIPKKTGRGFEWRAIRLGLVGTASAEVVSGLSAGESIVAHPDELPAPPTPPMRVGAPLAVDAGPSKAG